MFSWQDLTFAFSLEELQVSLQLLEGQAKGFSSFIAEAQSSVPDVKDMRKTITEAALG